jgi:WD40 repeat protein
MAAKPKRRKSKDDAPIEATSTRSGGANLDSDPVKAGAPLTGHTGIVLGVAFSPDNTMLASGGSDTIIILWDVSFESWQARACHRANRNLTPAAWQQYFGDAPYRKTCSQWPEGSELR